MTETSETEYRLQVTIAFDLPNGLRKGDLFNPFSHTITDRSELAYSEQWWRDQGHQVAVEERTVTHHYSPWT